MTKNYERKLVAVCAQMVKFEDVTKRFGSITALEDVSFEIEAGEFVFVTGPSGAGKTTLTRLLLRDIKPDQGKILIEGKDIGTLKPRDLPYYRRKVGVVFQDFKLLFGRTVWENVALALEVSGEQGEEKRIKEALDEVGLLDRASLFPRQLAGGEQQRVVIARALVARPRLILADEPTGNLDPATSRQIVELLDRQTKEDGTTVVMATHNENIVNSLKRRVLLFRNGKLVSDRKGKYEV